MNQKKKNKKIKNMMRLKVNICKLRQKKII